MIMKTEEVIARLDWASVETQLDHEGYAILPGLLSESQVRDLVEELPPLVADLRASFCKHLAPIANRWSEVLGVVRRYPRQVHSQSSLSRLRQGDYQPLHQQTDGEQAFPLQLIALLSEPDKDFTGGEFVMTEQRPRMQSRPMVLPLRKGDMAIITVAQRPHNGTKGHYRVNLKHAISRVRSGERVGLELLLDDAS